MLLGFALAAVALGALYQALATVLGRAKTPSDGRFVSVDGHRMYLRSIGAKHAGPVVIFEAALGATSAQWAWIQPAVASTFATVSYDRAGLGWSEAASGPRDVRQITTELHTALRGAGVLPPYVLVGHSLGGLFVRVFADSYPDEVVGMVLVDATHPDQWTRLPTANRMRRAISVLTMVGPWLARFAVFRVIDGTGLLDLAGLPADARSQLRASLARTGHWQTARAEVAAWNGESSRQARQARWVAGRPIAVISAGESVRSIPGVDALQAELATLSSCGTRQTVDGARHMSLVGNRAFAEVVVREVLAVARGGEPSQTS